MRQSAVTNWLISEVESYLTNSSLVSLSTPADHVDVIQERDPPTYPFVGIQKISTVSDSSGIGNNELFVDSLTYDNNDVLSSITYRRDVTLRVNIIPTTDNDPKLRDDLAEDLADHFALYTRTDDDPDTANDVPTDMEPPSVDEGTPQGRPEEYVDADGVAMEIEYRRFITDSSPTAAETVNVDIDVADDPDNAGTDAYDETFN